MLFSLLPKLTLLCIINSLFTDMKFNYNDISIIMLWPSGNSCNLKFCSHNNL
jgi:hypothetical protein